MKKYTYDYCKEIAKQFTTKKELANAYPGVMDAIYRYKWKDILTHMHRYPKKRIYTYEFCKQLIGKYEYLKDFREENNKIYCAIIENKWYDILNGLKRTNSANTRLIYAYEFPEYKAAYIGLTYNLLLRNNDHHRKGSVFEFARRYKIENYEPIVLKENIPAEKSGYYENFFMVQYKTNGWNLINRIRAGGLGGVILKNDEGVIFNESGDMLEVLKISDISEKYNIPVNLIRICIRHENNTCHQYKIIAKNEWEIMGSPNKIEPFKAKLKPIAILDENLNLLNICKNKMDARQYLGLTSINNSLGKLENGLIFKSGKDKKVCYYEDFLSVQNGDKEIIEYPVYHFKRQLIIPKNLSIEEKKAVIEKLLKPKQWQINAKKKKIVYLIQQTI